MYEPHRCGCGITSLSAAQNPTCGLGSELVHLQGLIDDRIGHSFPRRHRHEAIELRGWEGGGRSGGGGRTERGS